MRLYLAATRAVRRKFIPPAGTGGAAFIDLFAGPGRVRVRNTKATEPGSALIAQEHHEAPFTRLILCDMDPDNVRALNARTRGDARVHVVEGDCNQRINDITALVPPDGLNLAFLDPFGANLFWKTIEKLAQVKRMDLLVHFPTNTIKRNLFNPAHPDFDARVDRMVGNNTWRNVVRSAKDVTRLIDVLRAGLVALGYDDERVNTLQVTNDKGGVLYHLVFASKDRRGTAIWKSISRHEGPQRGLGF